MTSQRQLPPQIDRLDERSFWIGSVNFCFLGYVNSSIGSEKRQILTLKYIITFPDSNLNGRYAQMLIKFASHQPDKSNRQSFDSALAEYNSYFNNATNQETADNLFQACLDYRYMSPDDIAEIKEFMQKKDILYVIGTEIEFWWIESTSKVKIYIRTRIKVFWIHLCYYIEKKIKKT